MSNVKIKLNKAGVRELLKSAGAAAECKKYADQVYNRVNSTDGYEVKERNYPERHGYAVTAISGAAREENKENNTLRKALY